VDSLLNPRRLRYFVEKKKRHLEDGNIFDESGNVIGLIKKRKNVFSIKLVKKINFQDVKNTILK